MKKQVYQIQKFIAGLSREIKALKDRVEALSSHEEDGNAIVQFNEIDMELYPDVEGLKVDGDIGEYLTDISSEMRILKYKIKKYEKLEVNMKKLLQLHIAMPKRAKDERAEEVHYDKSASMFEKIKYVITSRDMVMSTPEIIHHLREFGEDFKLDKPEYEEENKKLFSSISATLKVYTDRGDFARCHLPGSNLYFYGLPSFFVDGMPFEEYMPNSISTTPIRNPNSVQLN